MRVWVISASLLHQTGKWRHYAFKYASLPRDDVDTGPGGDTGHMVTAGTGDQSVSAMNVNTFSEWDTLDPGPWSQLFSVWCLVFTAISDDTEDSGHELTLPTLLTHWPHGQSMTPGTWYHPLIWSPLISGQRWSNTGHGLQLIRMFRHNITDHTPAITVCHTALQVKRWTNQQ